MRCMAAPGTEAVMRKDIRAKCDRGVGGSRWFIESPFFIPKTMRGILLTILLAGFGWQALSASPNSDPPALIVRRTAHGFQHKFIIRPSEPTVAADQVQRFEVTDAQGKPVAVHWNVSGLGCSGLACGSIDDKGVYRTPASLPEPQVVTLEGVLVSDPNYSVLTQIQLAPAAATKTSPASAPVPAPVSTPEIQQIADLAVGGRSIAAGAQFPPLPHATAPPPVVQTQTVASRDSLPSLPNAVTAPPAMERQSIAHGSLPPALPAAIAAAPSAGSQIVSRKATATTLPLPNALAAAPVVQRQTIARGSPPPLPSAIAAAPGPEIQIDSRSASTLPLPKALAAAPVVQRQTIARGSTPSLPAAVAAAPAAGSQIVSRKATTLPLPNALAAAPVIERQTIARGSTPPLPSAIAAAPGLEIQVDSRNASTIPLPRAVAAAPTVGTQLLAHNSPIPPLPAPIATRPTDPIPTPLTRMTNAPVAGKSASGTPLLPLPDDSAETAVATQNAPVVTYRDGQLTIDARNATLAEVLKLVAEKSGAAIEVPPGSGLERIFEHDGPAPAQDVLVRLLNGSAYDFIIVSSSQNPNMPAQVLLSLRGEQALPGVPPEVTNTATASVLWTPPPTAPSSVSAPLPIDPASLPPKESLTPEIMGKLMRERAQQLREQLQPQQQQ